MVKLREMFNGLFRSKATAQGAKVPASDTVSTQIAIEHKKLKEEVAKESQSLANNGKTTKEDIDKIIRQYGHKSPIQILKEDGDQIFYIAQKFSDLLYANFQVFSKENELIKQEIQKIKDLGGKVDPLITQSQTYYEKEIEPLLKKRFEFWNDIKRQRVLIPSKTLCHIHLEVQMGDLNNRIKSLREANAKILNKG